MKSSNILSRFYEIKKRENPHFSIKLLSEKLSLSKSYTHQILKGDRNPPLAIVDEICFILDIDEVNRDLLINYVFSKKGLIRNKAKASLERMKLVHQGQNQWRNISKRESALIKNWYYMPILDCTLLRGYNGTHQFIAQKLSLDEDSVEDAFVELKKMGYLVKNKKGFWVKAYKFIEFNSKISKVDIRNFHKTALRRIESAITDQTAEEDVEKRLLGHFLFSCRPKDIPLIKQKISVFAKNIVEEYGSYDSAEEIYQFAFQLVPLTK